MPGPEAVPMFLRPARWSTCHAATMCLTAQWSQKAASRCAGLASPEKLANNSISSRPTMRARWRQSLGRSQRPVAGAGYPSLSPPEDIGSGDLARRSLAGARSIEQGANSLPAGTVHEPLSRSELNCGARLSPVQLPPHSSAPRQHGRRVMLVVTVSGAADALPVYDSRIALPVGQYEGDDPHRLDSDLVDRTPGQRRRFARPTPRRSARGYSALGGWAAGLESRTLPTGCL